MGKYYIFDSVIFLFDIEGNEYIINRGEKDYDLIIDSQHKNIEELSEIIVAKRKISNYITKKGDEV